MAYMKQWPDLFIQMSDSLLHKGKIKDAIAVLEFLGKELDNDKGLLFGTAEMYKVNKQHKETIEVYEKMIAKGWAKNDPRPWHYAGYSYYELGNKSAELKDDKAAQKYYQTALDYYDEALTIFPDYGKCYFNKSLLYSKLENKSPSEKDKLFEKAFDISKENEVKYGSDPRNLFTLAILYAEEGKWEKCLEYVEKTIQEDKTYLFRAKAERAFQPITKALPDEQMKKYAAGLDEIHRKYKITKREFSLKHMSDFDTSQVPE